MNCATHQQTPAVAYCRTCGKPLCESCKREVQGLLYCEQCIAARVHGASATGNVANPQAPNPGVALVLGMIPGVGAMYCGEFTRAVIHVAVFAGLIVAVSTIHWMFGPMIGFWWLYMIWDSYHIAKAKQEGRPIPEILGFRTASFAGFAPSASSSGSPSGSTSSPPLIDPNRSQNMPIGPIILIGLGVLFLLHTIGVHPFDEIGRLWPLAIIAVGGWMIWQRTQRVACRCVVCTATSLMGPALVVTGGVMGLLHEFTRFGFGETWPLLLIVLGVLKFLQITGSREGHIGPGSPPIGTPPPDASSGPSQQNEVSHG
jgi:hypothetical protein